MKLEYVFFCMIMINFRNTKISILDLIRHTVQPIQKKERRQDDYFNALIITSFNSKVRNPVEKSDLQNIGSRSNTESQERQHNLYW